MKVIMILGLVLILGCNTFNSPKDYSLEMRDLCLEVVKQFPEIGDCSAKRFK